MAKKHLTCYSAHNMVVLALSHCCLFLVHFCRFLLVFVTFISIFIVCCLNFRKFCCLVPMMLFLGVHFSYLTIFNFILAQDFILVLVENHKLVLRIMEYFRFLLSKTLTSRVVSIYFSIFPFAFRYPSNL